jgi:hypothetical protein
MPIMGLPEDEFARIYARADAVVDREIWQSRTVTWRTIEASLPPKKTWEIKRCINDLRHR